jgi:putative drug exporter of the RND superfamily
MMDRLTNIVTHHRRAVIIVWTVLTLFGMFAAGKMADRFAVEFGVPGYSAYEANQRTLATLGSGEIEPFIAVLSTSGDITKVAGVDRAITTAAAATPGSRVSSYFDAQESVYLSPDRSTMYAAIYPAGKLNFDGVPDEATRTALVGAAPPGVTAHLTGLQPLFAETSGGDTGGPSILLEAIIGGFGALIILFFTFGTLPAVMMPLIVALASILNTFTLVWIVSYVTDVSLVVQFLIALVGLGVAIDYALLMIFRFREELRHGADTQTAVATTMRHAGRSVIVSGSTVAVGLVSMIIIPVPFIRSIGIGGMLIPAVSVLATITLLPALLSLIGPKINSVRVLPRRMVEGSDDPDKGFWNRWGRTVMKRPVLIATIGTAVVAALLFYGVQLNPASAQAKDYPGAGDAHTGYQALVDSGISPGALLPMQVVIEGPGASGDLSGALARVAATPGIAGAALPKQSRAAGFAIIEAIGDADAAAKSTDATIERLRDDVVPALQNDLGAAGTAVTLGGVGAQDRDFIDAVYGKFPWVLGFVILLTYILLMRAFRSVILPLKAVILNLVSLLAAFGIIVFIFQKGHGSEAIWNVPATDAIISWIPLMIFAFLYGLSMDYEVFMLTRMREAYDETGSTTDAVALGLARTGKLVTSAALVLMFAFFVLSLSPGTDIKQFGIGLAAGIIFDATVIRALLVPSIMRLLGRWNWWMPKGVARILRVVPSAES